MMAHRIEAILLLVLAMSCGPAAAEDLAAVSPFSFLVSPSFALPLGPGASDFELGAGGKLSMEYAIPALKNLSLRAGLLYGYQALQAQAGSISELGAVAGAAWAFPFTRALSSHVFAEAGYAFGVMNGDSLANGGGSGLAEAGAGLAYALNPTLALRFDLSYRYYFDLYGALTASLALSVTPPAAAKPASLPLRPAALDFGDITLQSVFPIFHTWYDQNPVGSVVVKNAGKQLVTNVTVSFFIKQYMDGRKECATIDSLQPGESREVPLYALFNSSVLEVTEATKAISEVSATYTEAGESQGQSRTATIRVYNRNAMCWDDDRKAAAFVSGKDPWVQDFATGVAASVKKLMNANVNGNLQLAIAFHDALRLYGMSYTPNPSTPYSQTSTHPEIVDFVRFPRQTLLGRVGDCSDLSVLYASIFESVGKETAFITVPGHIFMAVCLDVTPAEARASVAAYDDLIIRDGKVWLPIETTLRDHGLLDAWHEGASEWRQRTADATAAFYPLHEAWKVYEPVGLAADGTSVKIPASDLVAQTFTAELASYMQQELHLRVTAVNDSMAKNGKTARGFNARGVVYARYGSLNLAEMDFQAALRMQPDYAPALVNLGNLARLKLDHEAALTYYRRAAGMNPDDARLQINLALTAATLGDEATASRAFAAARTLDPELTARYSAIGDTQSHGTRAAEAGPDAVLWDSDNGD